tara:strand:+ start:772 stop:1323 length:552 start_codon:yes stop_codon:yes gene_type:complete
MTKKKNEVTLSNSQEVQETKIDVTKLNVYQKLHLAIAIAKTVQKQNAGRYKAGAYNDVIQVVKNACTTARLALICDPKWQKHENGIECLVHLRVVDIDNATKSEDNQSEFHNIYLGSGHAYTQYRGNDDQAKASGGVFSYAHKYICQKAFCLNVEDGQDLDFSASQNNGGSLEDVLGITTEGE